MADLIEQGGEVIGTYQYGDIADGQGYTTYYLYTDTDSAATEYNLGNVAVYSSTISTTATATTTITAYTSTFNTPRVLKGNCIFNFMIYVKTTNGAFSWTPSIKVYHYDGTTSTQLGSTWTGVSRSTTDKTYTILAKVPITAAKKFARGDQLKIEFVFTETGSGEIEVTHDPQNRDANNITPSTDATDFTQSIALIPFKIDIG